jgi:hypothetical protein
MSKPRKKNTAKGKKKKNLKDPPAEDLFPDWPPQSLRTSKSVLEEFSSPAKRSDISRLDPSQRKSGRTVNSPPAPVDRTPDNFEINSSDSLPSNESQDDTGKQANDYLSALSGSSPGGSSIGPTCSEDSKHLYKYTSSGDKSCSPFYQDATPKHLAEYNKESPGSLSSTDLKYSSKSVSPFDQESPPKHPGKFYLLSQLPILT